MKNHERKIDRGFDRRVSNGMLIFAAGFLISSIFGRCTVSEDVEQVQKYGPQVEAELVKEFGEIESLYLDGGYEFRFDTPITGGPNQRCEGEYEVVDEVAKVSGQITCTQVTELGGN